MITVAGSHYRTACVECDLIIEIEDLHEAQSATCPRCGNVVTSRTPDALSRSLAFTSASIVLLVLANTFPFLALEAKGLENVMTLPRTALELYRDGYLAIAVLVLGPIVGIPAMMLTVLAAVLVRLRTGQPAHWLAGAGRLLSTLSPWSMVEVFVIGVLVSLVKIGAMATVVLGIAFWSYVAFAICFSIAISSLDRLQLWTEIEACTP